MDPYYRKAPINGHVYYIEVGGKVIYIGSAAEVKYRYPGHPCRCEGARIYYAEVYGYGKNQKAEKALINKYKPILNVQTYDGTSHEDISFEDLDFKYLSTYKTNGKRYLELTGKNA